MECGGDGASGKEFFAAAEGVAARAGVTPGLLNRLERGHLTELGVRKLGFILAVLGMELQLKEKGFAGSLDELRKERGGS